MVARYSLIVARATAMSPHHNWPVGWKTCLLRAFPNDGNGVIDRLVAADDIVTFWDRLLAAVIASSLPVVLLFLILQRYYIRGIATTGIR